MEVIIYKDVADKIVKLHNQQVMVDSDVATLYDTETREINKAVKNNPDKFPNGYIIELDEKEKVQLVENFHRFNKLKHSTVLPKAFTEKGLYMLATILRSPQATAATLSIIEAFTSVREINRTIAAMIDAPDESSKQKKLTQKAGELIGKLIMPDESDLKTVSVKTTSKFKLLSMLEITKETTKVPK